MGFHETESQSCPRSYLVSRNQLLPAFMLSAFVDSFFFFFLFFFFSSFSARLFFFVQFSGSSFHLALSCRSQALLLYTVTR